MAGPNNDNTVGERPFVERLPHFHPRPVFVDSLRAVQSAIFLEAGLMVESGPPTTTEAQIATFEENYASIVKSLPSSFVDDRHRSLLGLAWGAKSGTLVGGAKSFAKNKENKKIIMRDYVTKLPKDVSEIPSGRSLHEMYAQFVRGINLAELRGKEKKKRCQTQVQALQEFKPARIYAHYRDSEEVAIPTDYHLKNKDCFLLLAFKVFRTSILFAKDAGRQATDKKVSRAMRKEEEDRKDPAKKTKRDEEEDHVRANRDRATNAKLQLIIFLYLARFFPAKWLVFKFLQVEQSKALLEANRISSFKAMNDVGNSRLDQLMKLHDRGVYSKDEFQFMARQVVRSLPALTALDVSPPALGVSPPADEKEASDIPSTGSTERLQFSPRDAPLLKDDDEVESVHSVAGSANVSTSTDANNGPELLVTDVAVIETDKDAPAYRFRGGEVRRIASKKGAV